MTTAWRICKAKHAATAFDGLGAKLNGGRWNSPGVPMVYTSAVAAQALLELLVHADTTILSLSFVLIPVRFDDRLVRRVDTSRLPVDWKDNQAATRKLGDRWIANATSVVLAVPSTILDKEANFIINPAHPEARRLEIGSVEPLVIDERIKQLFRTT